MKYFLFWSFLRLQTLKNNLFSLPNVKRVSG
nr:MAG TPA: hypothetical protein [Caudoviricetes sp.]